jgi:hypothetical protein
MADVPAADWGTTNWYAWPIFAKDWDASPVRYVMGARLISSGARVSWVCKKEPDLTMKQYPTGVDYTLYDDIRVLSVYYQEDA